jgi:two-component system alkaline phosphatase synthesis response regulator PhoP
MKHPLILVVDDEEHMLNTVRFILESDGFGTMTARNAEEARELALSLKAKGEQLELILTDIQMPGITGVDLVDQLRGLGVRAPVLVMTGYNSKATADELRRKGLGEVLEKPFEEEELLVRVRLLCERGLNEPGSRGPNGVICC